MAMQALGLFLLELATGTSLLLLFFPHRVIGKGFFALHGFIALLALLLAALVAPAGLPRPLAAAGLAALALYTLFGRMGLQAKFLPALGIAAAAEVIGLHGACRALAPEGAGWIFAGALLGALLLGSVLLTMNLGHWYLVSRSLPLSLLSRAAAVYSALAAARGIYLGMVAAWPPSPDGWEALTSLDREGLFFLFRVLWGVCGPIALSYYVFRTARIKSNQAATGLLYVALIFVLIGEILSAYLTVATRFPA
jgi:protein NrfD